MPWDKVCCGFDIEEETRNFGTRAVALGQDAVFESSTLAVIESSDPESLSERPRCISKCHSSGLAIVLDSSLLVFNGNVSLLSFNVDFGSQIERFEWSQDGSFIYLGLHTGALFALHIPTETTMRLSSNLDPANNAQLENSPFFAKIKSYCTESSIDIVVITTAGKIIRIVGACRKDIVDCCNSSEEPSVKRKALSKIINEYCKFNVHQSSIFYNFSVKTVEDSYFDVGDNLIIFAEDKIQVWSKMDGVSLKGTYPLDVHSNEISKAYVTPDQHFIICLLKTGELLYISMYTFETVVLKDDINILDFSFIITGEQGADCNILMLTGHSEQSGRDLRLLSYPGSKSSFNLTGISDSVLPIGLEDNLYYLELFGENTVDAIKIKTIVESEPKLRLDRLLRRGKFAEAEEFSKCFNLEMTEVNKCKALNIADEISIWHQGSFSDAEINKLFESLIAILEEISDTDFIVELCTVSVPCKLEFINKLLKYASSRLDKLNCQGNECVNYAEKIYSLIKLFRTFLKLKNISHSPTSWAEFSSKHFFKDCQNYISKGDVKSAEVLCSGHWSEISAGLVPSSALTLLTSLPLCLPQLDLFYWVNHYVPLFLNLHEDSLTLFTQWISETINLVACIQKDLEMCHELVVEVLTVLNSVFNQCSYLPYYRIPLANYLISTAKMLKKFIYLKCEHNVIIPFERMPSSESKEEKVDFITSILENVPFGGMKILMEYFVVPYCSEHSLRCDEIILNFIKSSKVIGFSKDEWEMRCIKYTELISNKTERMVATLYVLSEASIPWSSIIFDFEATSTKTSDKFYKNEISNIKNKMIVQTLLLKCGIPHYELQDISWSKTRSLTKLILAKLNCQNEAELFKDVVQLTQVGRLSSTLFKIHCAYLRRSLSEGCLKDALKLIEGDAKKEIPSELYEWSANYLEQALPYSFTDDNVLKLGYKEKDVDVILSQINYKLPESKLPSNYLQVMEWLWMNFKVKIHINNLFNLKTKTILVKKCVKKLFESFEDKMVLDDSYPTSHYINLMKDFAINLEMPVWCTYFELATEAINIAKINIAIESIRCLTVENAVEVIPSDKVNELAMQVFRSYNPLIVEYKNFYEPLANLMKTVSSWGEASNLSDEDWIPSIILNLLHKDNFKKPTWYPGPVYIDAISQQPDISREDLMLLIKLLTDKGANYSTERNITDMSETFLSDLLKKLPHCLHSIAISSALLLAFEVRSLITEGEINKIKSVITQMVSNTLLKVVYSNSFDLHVALSLLSYFSHDHALKWIDNVSFKTEAFRLHNLAHLARQYCYVNKLLNQLKDYDQLFTISLWDRKFQKFGISFQGIFDDDLIKISRLKTIMKLPDFNITILENYCASFACDIQQYLFYYLSQVLLTWKLNFTIKDGEFIVESRYEELYDKCQNIAMKINCDNLANKIHTYIWDKINPYYYEVFTVMINLINEMGRDSETDLTEYEFLLNFLTSYKRISPPGESEQEEWKSRHDDDICSAEYQELQSISQFRLPFRHLPTDVWNFIKPELTLDSYRQWLAVPSWLGKELPNDAICAYTITNMKNDYANKNWDLQLKRKDVLSKIEECISHISTYELVTSTLYFVVNYVMPPGADQVEAAQHCLFKAIDWKEKEDNEASRAGYARAEKKYLSISVKHTLNKHNLAKSDYLCFATQPVELIKALYHDSSLVDDFTNSGINEAAASIAKHYNNPSMLADIKKELLFKWISENSSRYSNDSTTDIDFLQENMNSFENLKRAVYMLKDEDMSTYCSLLMNVIFTEEFSKPVQMKLKALQVLLSIVPHREIHTITGKTTEEIMEYLENLQFVYELERVGIFYSVHGFVKKNKSDLLLDLLMNSTPQKSVIAVNIADTYSVRCINTWNKILETLTSYSMTNELKKYLVKICTWSVILNMRILVNAWNTLVLSYAPKVNSNKEDCEDFINLFLNCPVLDKLDFSCIPPKIRDTLLQY